MNNVSGSFFIDMIIDGDSAQGNIRSTKPLVQQYDPKSGNCIPDWTDSTKRPVIYPVIRSGNENTIKAVVSGSEKWYYNGAEITFNSSGIATAPSYVAGLVKATTYTVSSISMPALQIIGNLANGSNMDADTIRMTGKIEASGHQIDFGSEISIAISEYTDSAYTGFIYDKNEKGGIIDDANGSVTLTQELYASGQVVPKSDYTVKWRLLPSDTIFSTSSEITLTANDINSKQSVICEFIIDNTIVASYIMEVSDESDPYFVTVAWDSSTTLEKDATLTGQCQVRKTGTGAVQTGWTFAVTMTKTNGSAFSPTTAATSAGKITLTYADVKNAGGSITGYMKASK